MSEKVIPARAVLSASRDRLQEARVIDNTTYPEIKTWRHCPGDNSTTERDIPFEAADSDASQTDGKSIKLRRNH